MAIKYSSFSSVNQQPFRLTAEFNPAKLTAKLEALARRLKTYRRTANIAVSTQLYAWTIKNFDTEGSSFGGWKALRPATVKAKKREGKEKILVRTGALRASFLPFHSDDNAGIGTELEYSVYHENGVPSRNLPKRPMLPPRKVVLDIGMKVYQFYIDKAIKQS